ncbi:MAG: hypothetical protein GVY16_07710 [Planctomycetes bacterium]|jgi:hypothetical membrane protein|nr:hypothetical protein [Phycisphaerae bacterium]NBB95612.1 hypothetical protein [Planctomycetota bacterium]
MNPPSTSRGRTVRLACALIVICVLQFILAAAASAALYPGGHPWNTDADGYSVSRNTLSDLGKDRGNNGEPATAAADVFNVSTALLTPGFAAMWLVLPRLMPTRPRTGRAVRMAGLISSTSIIAIALTPADRVPTLHTLAIGIGAVPGLLALATACAAMFVDPRASSRLAVATLAVLAVGMVHFGQYVRHFWLGGPWTPACPAVQKLAAISALAWMLAVAALAWPRKRRTHPNR